ncbi:MAG: DEAD/DEAH box helicase, partial [Prevotella sp.]|nr:DEAD/DEAH box helicase [Prevotella sp.]
MDIQKILSKLRIEQLNEMQQHAAEAIQGSDGDVVLLSPTGSGKTLAYMLPLLQLLNSDSAEVQAMVVTPGRELAL